MSTILKALRRLEREKATPAESRSLREAVTSGGGEPTSASARRSWLVPGMALLLGIGVGASFLLLWPRGDVEAASGNEVVAAVASPTLPVPEPGARVPVAAPPAPGSAQVDAEGLPSEAFSSGVEVVPRPARQPRIRAPEAEPAPSAPALAEAVGPAPPSLSSPPPPLPKADPAATRVAQAPPPEPDPWVAEPPRPGAPGAAVPMTDLPEPPPALPERRAAPVEESPAPSRAAARRSSAEPPAPSVVEPPRSAPPRQPASPAVAARLEVERTWWHPLASRREALLRVDGEALRVTEGQRVADATVTKIEPSAVVFTRGGTAFRRQVGAPAPPAD